jgi:hypothetical protein
VTDNCNSNPAGLMSRIEIRGLYDSLKSIIEGGVDSDLKAKIIGAAAAFLNMMDSNLDNKLSREEIVVFCNKMIGAFCEFYTLLVNSAKVTPFPTHPCPCCTQFTACASQMIIKGTLPSIVGLLFDIKVQLVGGDVSRLSKDEVFAALARHEAATYPSRTQLHWEAMRGNASMVAALIAKGGLDLNATDDGGIIPLHLAAQYSHREVVLELLSSKADVRAKSAGYFGQSALELAEQNSADWKASTRMWENEAVKEILKRNGCDGWTPLMVEAEKGDIPALQGLVYQRGDIGARNDKGATALHYAVSPEVVQILLGAGAELDALDQMGHTPLYYAAADGRIPVIECLLDSRADPDLKDQYGNRALEAAGWVCRPSCLFKFLCNSERESDSDSIDLRRAGRIWRPPAPSNSEDSTVGRS